MTKAEAIAAFVRGWLALPDSPLPWLHDEAPWLRPLTHGRDA